MYSILIYGFPVILVVFESALRFILKIDTFGFLGPTLAATGITSLASAVRPKTQEITAEDGRKFLAISKLDNQFIAFCWLIIFCMLLAWAGSCYASNVSPDTAIWGVQIHFGIGVVAYIVSMSLVAIKGIV